MFNKSNFCHIASNNRNEQKGSVFIYKTTDTLAQVTQSGYFNEKLIDINLHDLIIHVQYNPVDRTLKKSVLIVTERTLDNVETAPILDQTIGDDIADLGDQVQGIEEKIPGTASAQNQLTDKLYVDTNIENLQNTKATKATDFQTPITSTNKGATMKEIEEVITSSLIFKGYISTTEPEGGLVEGNLWINSSSLPTTFPVPAVDIKTWNGSAWVASTESYTPIAFDSFRNNNDNEGYYWFGGEWVVLSTDLSTEYFVLNQTSGKWEIKPSINLPGTPTVQTPAKDNAQAVANVGFIQENALSTSTISNCPIVIPQDINLELTNGTLTLKAGSKVYVPNGEGVFDTITIANDISKTITWASNSTRLLFVKDNGTLLEEREFSFSGATAPTSQAYSLWYDTTNNAVKYTSDSGSTWTSGNSFPIALITSTNNVITSIDYVFNGRGHVGSSIFALPGLKYAISNGRNSDGTLKNIIVTLTKVHVGTLTYGAQPYYFALNNAGNIVFCGTKVTEYDEDKNIVIDTYAKKTVLWALLGTYTGDSSKLISDWNPKDTFHAVSYDDLAQAAPVPDYSSAVTIATGWVAPYNCVGFCSKKQQNNNRCTVQVNGVTVFVASGTEYTEEVGAQWFVPKGATVTFSGTFQVAPVVYPLKGV